MNSFNLRRKMFRCEETHPVNDRHISKPMFICDFETGRRGDDHFLLAIELPKILKFFLELGFDIASNVICDKHMFRFDLRSRGSNFARANRANS